MRILERSFDYHVVGKKHVDLRLALELLSEKYDAKTVLADTGRILGNLLLGQGLVAELSLLVHPVIVGKNAYNVFGNVGEAVSLKLRKQEVFGEGYVWLVYEIPS
ncbi:MAG: dihydrofolate reductase family protein [Candidatus Bathyarchaeota archaeon]|nr:dihydrofolate reductase family protein [Candidatus Bathyarchaeota archaeon]